MRLLFALLASLAVSGGAHCQTVVGPEQVIKRIIDSGGIEGHDQKIIAGMGDAAAVLVTKVVTGRHLSKSEIDSVLVILNSSFAGRAQATSDREPRTALFVLQFCDYATQDPELKKRITQTRQYIQEQYANSLKDSATK